PGGGAWREGDSAAQPARRRPCTALPGLRDDAPLRALRRLARAPRRRAAALPPLWVRGAGPGELPLVRLGRARAPRRGDPATRAGAGEEGARARADPARRGHRRARGGAPPPR